MRLRPIDKQIAEVLENASPDYKAANNSDALGEIMRVVCRRNAWLPLSLGWPNDQTAPAPIRAAIAG